MSVSNAPTPRVTVLQPEVNQSDMTGGNASVRPRLLIVDDISDNRAILTRRFQRRGFDVVEAECGLTAIELIDKHSFDLVLLDVMMPGIDGIEIHCNERFSLGGTSSVPSRARNHGISVA